MSLLRNAILKHGMAVRLAQGLVLPVLALVVWDIAVRAGWANSQLWSSPVDVVRVAFSSLVTEDFPADLKASLFRHFMGFLIGSTIGLVIGLGLGSVHALDRLFGPTLHGIKQVAIFTWIPLLSIWIGTGDTGKVAFVALAAIFPVFLSTYEGVRSIDPRYRDVVRTLRFSKWQSFRHLIIPAALPSITSGVQLALVYGWLAVIGADYFFAASDGLGTALLHGRDLFRMDVVLFNMVVIGTIGFSFVQIAHLAATSILRRWGVVHD